MGPRNALCFMFNFLFWFLIVIELHGTLGIFYTIKRFLDQRFSHPSLWLQMTAVPGSTVPVLLLPSSAAPLNPLEALLYPIFQGETENVERKSKTRSYRST